MSAKNSTPLYPDTDAIDRSIDARVFDVIGKDPEPLISRASPGAEDNKYGFEGGTVVRLDGTYHLFTSEMWDDPQWVGMRLAHWKSDDGSRFERVSTLFRSTGDFTGTDPRAALWSPMPTFDEERDRWYLTYVAYRSAPNTEHQLRINMDGQIWIAESVHPGRGGIGGPYADIGVILRSDEEKDHWEGLQGTDSFFPYQIDSPLGAGARRMWCAFYGTCHTQKLPLEFLGVGLITSDSLHGRWKRRTRSNPVMIADRFVENPIVFRVGPYYALVYDGGDSMGCSLSRDGLAWSKGVPFDLEKTWEKRWRTPLCCIPESDGTWTVYYTAYDSLDRSSRFGAVGRFRVKLRSDVAIAAGAGYPEEESS